MLDCIHALSTHKSEVFQACHLLLESCIIVSVIFNNTIQLTDLTSNFFLKEAEKPLL
jgi:hypothetical protein